MSGVEGISLLLLNAIFYAVTAGYKEEEIGKALFLSPCNKSNYSGLPKRSG
ncbi:MAG: hypothetical protein AABZ10_15690 [Nitrospirota bacterium]